MVTFMQCKDDGSGCVTFYPEQERVKKALPVRTLPQINPAVLAQMRDMLLEIKSELPAYLQKQQMASIMKDPQRLAKLSSREIEDMFPRYEE